MIVAGWWLWNMSHFFHFLGTSSSQLAFILFKGVAIPSIVGYSISKYLRTSISYWFCVPSPSLWQLAPVTCPRWATCPKRAPRGRSAPCAPQRCCWKKARPWFFLGKTHGEWGFDVGWESLVTGIQYGQFICERCDSNISISWVSEKLRVGTRTEIDNLEITLKWLTSQVGDDTFHQPL